MACPGKGKHGLKPVFFHFSVMNFEPYPLASGPSTLQLVSRYAQKNTSPDCDSPLFLALPLGSFGFKPSKVTRNDGLLFKFHWKCVSKKGP